jgi:hypothetical protein
MSRRPLARRYAPFVSLLPLIVVSALGAAPAPQPNEDATFSLCGRARALVAVTNTARNEHLTGLAAYKDLAQSIVMIPAMPGFGAPAPCNVEAPAESVVDVRKGGEVPGTTLAAIADVLDYRHGHVWPLGPAHPDRWESEIRLAVRGAYEYVAIVDLPANAASGCRGQEYYRVDPRSFGVAPYDGCATQHSSVPGLRTISTLEQ